MLKTIKKFRLLFLCISGLLTALTVVYPKVGAFEWVTLIPMGVVLFLISDDRSISLKKIYLHGACFFMSFYLVIYHWFLYMYPMDFMDMEKGVAVLIVLVAWIGLSIVQTAASSLIFVVFSLVYRCRLTERFRMLSPFFLAALWATIEWTQTIGWWGVPWGRLCLGQTEMRLSLLSASLFGSYFVSFLIVAVNACLAYIFVQQKYTKFLANACVCMVVGNLILGGIITLAYNNEGNRQIKVGIVQGNIKLDEKWSGGALEQEQMIEEVHTKLTAEAAEAGADIVVWAETAFPYNITKSRAEYFSSLAESTGTTILASTFTFPETPVYSESGYLRTYNSLFEVREDGSFGERVYSKQRRVPFAEFVPLEDIISFLIPPLANLNQMSSDILPGEGSTVIETQNAGNIGCAICFDSIYEQYSLEAVRGGAEVIVVATNDAWFDDSAENYMHTSQSKLRAIETGRYVVRAANTGISGIVNPIGQFEQRLGIDEEGLIVGDIYLRNQTTLYTVIGNLFAYVCLAVSFAGFCTAVFIRIKDKRERRI